MSMRPCAQVMNPDGTAHETNYRQPLMDIIDDEILAQEPLYGFEQVRSEGRDACMRGR